MMQASATTGFLSTDFNDSWKDIVSTTVNLPKKQGKCTIGLTFNKEVVDTLMENESFNSSSIKKNLNTAGMVSRVSRNKTDQEKQEIIMRMRSHRIHTTCSKEYITRIALANDEELKECF